MKVTYYPGCSLEGTARDYADSIHGVCTDLGLELQDVPDWNCCGATAAHSVNHKASIELAGRNLRLAAEVANPDMVVPCPLCFNRLKTAASALQEEDAEYAVGYDEKTPKVWDLANFFAGSEMLARIKASARKPLNGMKVVCYYGCMASRPPRVTESQDHENPQSLDKIVKALGGTPLPWPYKTDCCGASLMISRPDMGTRMVSKLYDMAKRVGAKAIVVSCQMCQSNLDLYQDRIAKETGQRYGLPVIYFTELIGIAMVNPDARSWLSRHFVDAAPVLREYGL